MVEDDNVVQFKGLTKVKIPPAELLEKAKDWEMDTCVVLGWTEDGELKFGGSFSNVAEIYYMLSVARHEMMDDTIFDGDRHV